MISQFPIHVKWIPSDKFHTEYFPVLFTSTMWVDWGEYWQLSVHSLLSNESERFLCQLTLIPIQLLYVYIFCVLCKYCVNIACFMYILYCMFHMNVNKITSPEVQCWAQLFFCTILTILILLTAYQFTKSTVFTMDAFLNVFFPYAFLFWRICWRDLIVYLSILLLECRGLLTHI